MTSFQLCFSALMNCLKGLGCHPSPEVQRIHQRQGIETERMDSIRTDWQRRQASVPVGVRNERVVYARNLLTATEKLDKQLGFALSDPEGGKRRGRDEAFEVRMPLEAPEKWEYERFSDAVAQNDGAHMTQEDRYLRKQEVVFTFRGIEQKALLYGVFDGHNDDGKMGEFLNARLAQTLGMILTRLLLDAYSVSDELIANTFTRSFDYLSKKYREEQGKYGATASCAFIYKDKIFFPNVGDSRIILIKKEATYQLTEDASPANDRYLTWNKRARNIINRDFVKDPITKVESKVTRDIGMNWLCSRPKITRIFIGPKKDEPELHKLFCDQGDYLLLATDGLWKVATVAEVGVYVRKMLQAGFSPDSVATHLADHAGTLGGSDNVTVMIVTL